MNILKQGSFGDIVHQFSQQIDLKDIDHEPWMLKQQTKWTQDEIQIKDQSDPEQNMNFMDFKPRQSDDQVPNASFNNQEMRLIQSESSMNSRFSQQLDNQKLQRNSQKLIKQEKEKIIRKRIKNQTKNIPKNYGKAIITFIQKYRQIVIELTSAQGVDYKEFIEELKILKKDINTIADLRNLWIGHKYSKCMRILSNLFLRKYSIQYIFNSRISNYGSHIKYRHRIRQAIINPNSFKHIKDF